MPNLVAGASNVNTDEAGPQAPGHGRPRPRSVSGFSWLYTNGHDELLE